jgi:hypothetical protein
MSNNWILPEVCAEIEAMKKYRRQREQEQREECFFATELSPRYVLIDAALQAADMDGIL